MRRTLKANQTQHDILESLESFLEMQHTLYPCELQETMLVAIRTGVCAAIEPTKSFLQKYYRLRYKQEIPNVELAELTDFVMHFVEKTPSDRLAKFLTYTLDSKMKEVNHRTL